MAQIEGLIVTPTEANSRHDEPETAEEELCHKIMRNLRLGRPKAAMAHAVELVNTIAYSYGVNGSAFE